MNMLKKQKIIGMTFYQDLKTPNIDTIFFIKSLIKDFCIVPVELTCEETAMEWDKAGDTLDCAGKEAIEVLKPWADELLLDGDTDVEHDTWQKVDIFEALLIKIIKIFIIFWRKSNFKDK